MFTLIISIAIVYLLWLVVKPWLTRWLHRRFERKMTEMFARQFGIDPEAFTASARTAERRSPFGAGADAAGTRRRSRPRGKVIGRDVGEYVEFEELDGTFPVRPASAHTPMEAQVEDAEWEDLR